MPGGNGEAFKELALAFTEALAARDYKAGYKLTSRDYQNTTSLADMQAAFEVIVPRDWPPGPIVAGQTMDDWPGREPSDVGWVYVSIGGAVYSEAITVVVTLEDGVHKVRAVEFGRP
jgi:hypothetical protein